METHLSSPGERSLPGVNQLLTNDVGKRTPPRRTEKATVTSSVVNGETKSGRQSKGSGGRRGEARKEGKKGGKARDTCECSGKYDGNLEGKKAMEAWTKEKKVKRTDVSKSAKEGM